MNAHIEFRRVFAAYRSSSRGICFSLARAAHIALIIALGGCATLERGADHVRDFTTAHPVITAVAAGAAAGAIVVAIDDRHHHEHRDGPTRTPDPGLHTHDFTFPARVPVEH